MSKASRIERELHPKQPWKMFNWKLGYALLHDRRVGLHLKVGAFAVGFAAVAILGVLEFPIEEVVAMIPFLGAFGDLAVDGLEVIYLPFLVACVLLPHLVSETLVEQIRRERAPAGASPDGPIIDV